MREYTVKIKPLTPLWTGDAERKSGTLRETGIIGSLRWWYEALIRGLGGTACDPTVKESNTKCNYYFSPGTVFLINDQDDKDGEEFILCWSGIMDRKVSEKDLIDSNTCR